MRAFLMHPDRDFDWHAPLPDNAAALIQDLELSTLLTAMAADDQLLFDVAQRALLLSLSDAHAIAYRQEMLSDCLAHPSLVRDLYALAGDALAAERKVYGSFLRDSPTSLVGRSVKVLALLLEFLRRLRWLSDEHAGEFTAPGFQRFFSMITDELADDYLDHVEVLLRELRFDRGILISAQLGSGNRGQNYVPRHAEPKGWLQRIALFDRAGYSFTIPDRDEAGYRALRELEDQGLNTIANVLAQSTDHVLSFFTTLRIELGFYVACLNLRDQLQARSRPICLPTLRPAGELVYTTQGLYDASLALSTAEPIVGNDLAADGRSLVMITGANEGGKSTFLRAIGLAQLMAHAGMFVGADALSVNLGSGVFTHFKREEDEDMQSGKLDEELRRMSDIADHIRPGGLLLCNESFASTNEREGSEIARQVVRAMVDRGVKVAFVTHQFDLAHSFCAAERPAALFLRACRGEDGQRNYKLVEAPPLPTSYGADAYEKVFGTRLPSASA